MDPVQAIILAIVQGLSEFLPISSSGHLILVPHFAGWQDQGLAFDVAVHVGTLFAVVTYFRRQLFAMAGAWFGSLAGAGSRPMRGSRGACCSARSRSAWSACCSPDGSRQTCAIPCSSPARCPCFGAVDVARRSLRTPAAATNITVGWRDALLIGGAQALALMPGTSRSGVTMTLGRIARPHARCGSPLLRSCSPCRASAWRAPTKACSCCRTGQRRRLAGDRARASPSRRRPAISASTGC